LQALPWQQREALTQAVGDGKPVADPQLATLAADYAEVTHHRLVTVLGGVIAPLAVVVAGGMFWLLSSREDDFDLGGAVFAGVFAMLMMGLIFWAIALRPLVRGRRANLHLAGLAESPPSKRDASNWVIAWLIAWPIAALVGAGIRATGSGTEGPIAIVAWLAVLWFVKRALDDRGSR
jgi:hypothetical protein